MEMKTECEAKFFIRYKRGFDTHMLPVTATQRVFCDQNMMQKTCTGQLKGKSGNREHSKNL